MTTRGALAGWIPVATAIVIMGLLVYGAFQTSIRSSANEPQVQLAEDGAAALAVSGANAVALVGAASVDAGTSLAPFRIVFNKQGEPIASGATLSGRTPVVPLGALEAARAGEHRVTWQPAPGVRLAAVIVQYAGGYVVAARSLRESEARIDAIGRLVLAGTLVALVASLAVAAVLGART